MASLGRRVVYITERAVFELDANGQLLLTEVRSDGGWQPFCERPSLLFNF